MAAIEKSQPGQTVDRLPEPEAHLFTADIQKDEPVLDLDEDEAELGGEIESEEVAALPGGVPGTVIGLPRWSWEGLSLNLNLSRTDLNQYNRGSSSGFFCSFGVEGGLVDVPLRLTPGWNPTLVLKGYVDGHCPTEHEIKDDWTGAAQMMEIAPRVNVGLRPQLKDAMVIGPLHIDVGASIDLANLEVGKSRIRYVGGPWMDTDLGDFNGQGVEIGFRMPGYSDCSLRVGYREQEGEYNPDNVGKDAGLGRSHSFHKTQSVLLGLNVPLGSTCLTDGFDTLSMASLMESLNVEGTFNTKNPWYVSLGGGQMTLKGADKPDEVLDLRVGADVFVLPLWGDTRLVAGGYLNYKGPSQYRIEQDIGGYVDLEHAGKLGLGVEVRTDGLLRMDVPLMEDDLKVDFGGTLASEALTTRLGRNIPKDTVKSDGSKGQEHNDSRCRNGVSYGGFVNFSSEGSPVSVQAGVEKSECTLIHDTYMNDERKLEDTVYSVRTRVELEAVTKHIDGLLGR